MSPSIDLEQRTAPSVERPARRTRGPVVARCPGIALAVLSALVGLGFQDSPSGPRRALVVGNDAYELPVTPLRSCVNDADAVREWLILMGYRPGDVTMLRDVRRAELTRALRDLVMATEDEPHSEVVIYYSGHGFALPDDDGDEGPDDPLDEALVCIDPPVLDRGWDAFADSCMIRDDEFFGYIDALLDNAERVIVIFDSCFSAGGFKSLDAKTLNEREIRHRLGPRVAGRDVVGGARDSGSSVYPSEIRARGEGNRLIFIASSNPYQYSAAGSGPGSLSAFTEAFLAGFAPDGPVLADPQTGIVTLAEMRRYLERSLRDRAQTPLIDAPGLADDASFIPGIFADPNVARRKGRLERILVELLALPAEDRAPGWTIEARPSVDAPLRVGTRFCLRTSTNADGHLVVLAISPRGEVAFLYPNRYATRNDALAGVPSAVPYADGLVIQPGQGRETFVLFLLEENPFADVPLGEYAAPMAVGRLEEISRLLRDRGVEMTPTELRDSLLDRKAFRVRPAEPARESPYGRWTREVVTVRSIGP